MVEVLDDPLMEASETKRPISDTTPASDETISAPSDTTRAPYGWRGDANEPAPADIEAEASNHDAEAVTVSTEAVECAGTDAPPATVPVDQRLPFPASPFDLTAALEEVFRLTRKTEADRHEYERLKEAASDAKKQWEASAKAVEQATVRYEQEYRESQRAVERQAEFQTAYEQRAADEAAERTQTSDATVRRGRSVRNVDATGRVSTRGHGEALSADQMARGRAVWSVWSLPTQGVSGAHTATMPERLAERCVLLGSRPGDVVVDPFAGTCAVGRVALRHGRRFVGVDLNPACLRDLARVRTREIQMAMPLEATASCRSTPTMCETRARGCPWRRRSAWWSTSPVRGDSGCGGRCAGGSG